MSSSPEKTILSLNDDCLMEIFKYLPLLGLCSMRSTCIRLQTIADYYFFKEHKAFELNGKYVSNDPISELSLDDCRLVLQNFGRQIHKINLHSDAFSDMEFDRLIMIIERFCEHLVDLKFVKINFTAETIEKCHRLFSNLHRLVIDKCLDDNATFATCLMHSSSLKELELIRLFNIEGNSLAQAYPNLECFAVKSSDNINYEFLQEFIEKNPQLKKLKFIGCNFVNDKVFQQISDNLPNLESFSMRMVHVSNSVNENLVHLLSLTKLKKLELNCGVIGINTFLEGLAANNTIESLHLSALELNDETIGFLCNMKQLKVFKLTSTLKLDKDLCTKLASGLHNLTELHIVECTSTTFDELLEFVAHSASLNKLVYIQYVDLPSLNKQQFLSLVDIRKKMDSSLPLSLYLELYDWRNINDQFMWEGSLDSIRNNKDIVKLLPLDDEEDTSAVFDYGCGGHNRPFGPGYDDLFDVNICDDLDLDDDDDEFYDNQDSDYDDFDDFDI